MHVTSRLDEHNLAMSARRAAAHMVKLRARHFERRPLALERLFPGLSAATPEATIAIAEHLIDREARSPRRWFGFGGEVNLLNARALLLLGRLQRRQHNRIPMRVGLGVRKEPKKAVFDGP